MYTLPCKISTGLGLGNELGFSTCLLVQPMTSNCSVTESLPVPELIQQLNHRCLFVCIGLVAYHLLKLLIPSQYMSFCQGGTGPPVRNSTVS